MHVALIVRNAQEVRVLVEGDDLGEHATLDKIEAGFKSAWTHVMPQVCKAIRARVIRNMHLVIAQKGGSYYYESSTRGELVP